jgi:predicted nucleic-acid-binding protein
LLNDRGDKRSGGQGLGRGAVRITADTNLLLRVAVRDHVSQYELAERELAGADLVAVPLSALCEFVWVLSRAYKRPAADISKSIRDLMGSANVSTDREAVESGLAFLEAGGDFADGVVVHEGLWLGGEEFVSFDKKAVKLAIAQGQNARLLS